MTLSPSYILKKAEEDQHYSAIANKIIAEKKFISRLALAKLVGVSRERLNRLNKIGLIENYPKALSHSQASKVGRAKGNTWGKFRLPGSPTKGEVNAESKI